jgi:hypothetical protein
MIAHNRQRFDLVCFACRAKLRIDRPHGTLADARRAGWRSVWAGWLCPSCAGNDKEKDMPKRKSIIWNGIEYPSMAALAREKGVSRQYISSLIQRGITSDDRVRNTPGRKPHPFAWNGITYPSRQEAALALGITVEAVRYRDERGWTCDDDLPGKRCTVWNGVEYPSISAAARARDISVPTMWRWIQRGWTCDEDVRGHTDKTGA